MSTILTTIRWLSICTGALSLFYLGHTWFEFGLGEVFTRIYAWYAGILHPVVELLKPAALWLVGLLGQALPNWWMDATVLYFMLGTAMGRGGRAWNQHRDWGTEHARKMREEEERMWLLLAPIRMPLWPLFWVIGLVAALGPGGLSLERLLTGYVGTSLQEFSKILIGALIFAGLNAGLG